MYILDTDHISLIQRNGAEGKLIAKKLFALNTERLFVTVITYEEQIRGRLDVISRAKTVERRTAAYTGLHQLWSDYRSLTVIPFDSDASILYDSLKRRYPRLGKMDLRIAATTIQYEATLLTRNTSDFEKIDELDIADWSYL